MTLPDWNLITSSHTSPSILRNHLVSCDFSTTTDPSQLGLVVRHLQRLLHRPLFPCDACAKKFDSADHLARHRLRRHAETPNLAVLITESRDFLASEIRAAVKAALDAQAAVPVGVSFAGDLEISQFSASSN